MNFAAWFKQAIMENINQVIIAITVIAVIHAVVILTLLKARKKENAFVEWNL